MKQKMLLCITIGFLLAAAAGGCGVPDSGQNAGAAGGNAASDDASGTPADKNNPLLTNEFGQIIIYDLPYGTYRLKEIAAEVVEEALDKASKEKGLRKAVEGGMSVTEAFEKFGVL